MDVKALIRIERLNYLLGGVLVAVGALVFSRPTALGVLVGVALSCANFTVMRSLVSRWMSRAAGQRGASSFFMVPKMGVLMAAIALAIVYLPISGEGLALGFSIFLVSIGVETARFLAKPPAPGPSESGAGDAEN